MRTLTADTAKFWSNQLSTLSPAHQDLVLRLLAQHYGPQLQQLHPLPKGA